MPTPTLLQFLGGLAMGLYTPEQRVAYAEGFLYRDRRYDCHTLYTLRRAVTDEWGEAMRAAVEYNLRYSLYESAYV